MALAHGHGQPVLENLGSGCLVNLERFGIHGEPSAQASLKAGVDIVSFSGDKLLGEPQAGILLGKKEYMDRLKKHPLTWAMRVDKMTLAALEATLRSYERGCPEDIPVLGMLSVSLEALKEKAERLSSLLADGGIAAQVVAAGGWIDGKPIQPPKS